MSAKRRGNSKAWQGRPGGYKEKQMHIPWQETEVSRIPVHPRGLLRSLCSSEHVKARKGRTSWPKPLVAIAKRGEMWNNTAADSTGFPKL